MDEWRLRFVSLPKGEIAVIDRVDPSTFETASEIHDALSPLVEKVIIFPGEIDLSEVTDHVHYGGES